MPDLVTLAYVQAVAENDNPKSAPAYARLISAASAAFVNLCNRKAIAPTTFVDTLSGDGFDNLVLRNTPVLSVQSLALAGVPQTPYSLSTGRGYAVSDNGFTLELVGSFFPHGRRNVVVAYTAGYDPIPDDVMQAVAEMVIWKKAKMPRLDLVSQTMQSGAGETISYSQSELPPSVRGIIRNYWRPAGGFRSR